MIQTSGNIGMQTMDQCLRDIYLKGLATLEECMARAVNVEELKKMINVGGPNAPGGAGGSSQGRR
jgi:twitching motility protein PilT